MHAVHPVKWLEKHIGQNWLFQPMILEVQYFETKPNRRDTFNHLSYHLLKTEGSMPACQWCPNIFKQHFRASKIRFERSWRLGRSFGHLSNTLPSGKRLHNKLENHHISWEKPLFLWPCSSSQTVDLPGRVYTHCWASGFLVTYGLNAEARFVVIFNSSTVKRSQCTVTPCEPPVGTIITGTRPCKRLQKTNWKDPPIL